MDLFFNHFPISSLLDPSRRRKSVLHVRVTGLPMLRWSKSSKHFLPHSWSFLKLPLFAASCPSCDACSLQPALVVAIPHPFCPVLCFRCSCLLQFGPSCLFSEGVAHTVRPHRAYCRVPFVYLERHPIGPIVPPLLLLRKRPSLLRQGDPSTPSVTP